MDGFYLLGRSLGEMDIHSREQKIMDQYHQSGGDLSSIDTSKFNNPRDIQALGQVRQRLLEDANFQGQMFETQSKLAQQKYDYFNGGMQYINGIEDPNAKARAWGELTKRLDLPMSLEWDEDAKVYNVFERGKFGQPTDSGQTMTADEVGNYIKNFQANPEEFQRYVVGGALNNIAQNNKNMRDKSTWLSGSDSQGRHVTFVPYNKPGADGRTVYGVTTMQEGQDTQFIPFEELGKRGFSLQSSASRLADDGARLGMRLTTAKTESEIKKAATELTKDDSKFIEDQSTYTDPQTGEDHFDSNKASALGALIGGGLSRYEASRFFDMALQYELQNSPGISAQQASYNVAAKMFMGGGRPGAAPGGGAETESDPLAANLRNVAEQGRENSKPAIPALNKLPEGWQPEHQNLYAEYVRVVGEAPENGMTPEQAAGRVVSTTRDKRKQRRVNADSSRSTTLSQALGKEVSVPAKVADTMLELINGNHTQTEIQEATYAWRNEYGTEQAYQQFVEVFGVRPETLGLKPKDAMYILREINTAEG